jgi:hypothetical protein
LPIGSIRSQEQQVPADAIMENSRSRTGSASAANALASSVARSSAIGSTSTEQQSAIANRARFDVVVAIAPSTHVLTIVDELEKL